MNLDWEDIPRTQTGARLCFTVLPTVVLPNGMRPRLTWHGLGIMGSSEEVDVWAEEEKAEVKDPGINLDSAILNGGLDGLYLEMLAFGVEGLQVGKFDPEPRRLHKAAVNHDRPVFFIEPDMDDEQWVEFRKEAKAMTRPLKLELFLPLEGGGRASKECVSTWLNSHHAMDGLQAASALATTWWSLNEKIVEELNRAKDLRFASRLRGALSTLREEYGDESVLLVPIQQAWRKSMLAALESQPDAETSSSEMLPQERRRKWRLQTTSKFELKIYLLGLPYASSRP